LFLFDLLLLATLSEDCRPILQTNYEEIDTLCKTVQTLPSTLMNLTMEHLQKKLPEVSDPKRVLAAIKMSAICYLIIEGKLFSDYKSEVQEFIQKNGRNLAITYNTVREEGPAHDKTFFVNLMYDGQALGEGSGKSKKEAEQNAAKTALARLKRREIDVF